jgi:hypothetical protein
MPYSGVTEALEKHPNLKKYSAKARRGWVSSFNSAIESGKGESYAFAVAYSVANDVDGKENINDKKKAASLRFASENEALQYLSNFTGKRIIIALDVAELVDQVDVMSKLPVDEFVDDIDAFIEACKKESDSRKDSDNPAEQLMKALLDPVIKRTKEYKEDLEDISLDEVDDVSKKYKQDIEDLVERYNKGKEEVIRQQEQIQEASSQTGVE